jgi:hypothetical protein
MATRVNFDIDQGSDTVVPLTFQDSEGTAINFFGSTFRMQLRKLPDDAKYVDELSTDNGRITSNLTDGIVNLVFPSSVTSALRPVSYVYDLEQVNGEGKVTRLIEGEIRFRREVTR